jgi:hypothetical protein
MISETQEWKAIQKDGVWFVALFDQDGARIDPPFGPFAAKLKKKLASPFTDENTAQGFAAKRNHTDHCLHCASPKPETRHLCDGLKWKR